MTASSAAFTLASLKLCPKTSLTWSMNSPGSNPKCSTGQRDQALLPWPLFCLKPMIVSWLPDTPTTLCTLRSTAPTGTTQNAHSCNSNVDTYVWLPRANQSNGRNDMVIISIQPTCQSRTPCFLSQTVAADSSVNVLLWCRLIRVDDEKKHQDDDRGQIPNHSSPFPKKKMILC